MPTQRELIIDLDVSDYDSAPGQVSAADVGVE